MADEIDPIRRERLTTKIADCVHCGFCLPTCPTYSLWGEEMDSPRGRIHLALGLLDGDPLSSKTVGHFDACLGCMSCMSACPSDVDYSTIIETTRAHVEDTYGRAPRDRALRTLVFSLFPYPRRLRPLAALLRIAQRLHLDRLAYGPLARRAAPRLAAMAALAPRVPRRGRSRTFGASAVTTYADAPKAGATRVVMLTGCVQSVFFPGVNAATERVLAAEGCAVDVPGGQGCCGALSLHAGRDAEGRKLAAALIADIDPESCDAIITNAAGCGSTLKQYGELFADDPDRDLAERAAQFAAKVADVTEFLAPRTPVAARRPIDATVAYHDACHLRHAQRVRTQPRELLAGIPGLTVADVADPDICCGSAGTYNIFNPEPAAELGRSKARAVAATGAQALVAGNPGCLMHLQRCLRDEGIELPAVHTIEVLDAAISGTPLPLN
jgi:glycolate oxidase iron-sulfur subunit